MRRKVGTYYTAFGLTMAGISSKALNNAPENRTKFQGQEFANKEFSDGSGLDWYEFKYRMHDPQTGRFLQIDPLADKYVYNSPYAFSENKVTSHVELEGLETFSVQDLWRSAGITSSTDPKEYTQNVAKEATKPSTWMSALQMMSSVVGGVLLGILTEGIGSGSLVSAEVRATSTVSEASSATMETVEAGTTNLAERVKEVHGTLSPRTQNSTTTAMASATTSEGNSTVLVASSETNLRPAQRAALKPGEVAVSGNGHAETTIINYAQTNNMTVHEVAASRPICPTCATAINNAGATPVTPLKVVKPVTTDALYVRPPIDLTSRQQ